MKTLESLTALRSRARYLPFRKTVTVNIEDGAVKAMVTRGRRVVWWGSMPLEPGLVHEGLIVNGAQVGAVVKELLAVERVSPKWVIAGLSDPHILSRILGGLVRDRARTRAAIKELLAKQKVVPKGVVASLSGLHSLSRVLTLPKLRHSLLQEAIVREARRRVPVSFDTLDLSWQILGTEADELHLYFLGTPREKTDAQVQTLRRVGINPYLMDLRPLALARAAHRRNAFIIDFQPSEYDIIAVVDGVPLLTRTVPLPQEQRSPLGEAQSVVQEFLRTASFLQTSYPNRTPDLATPLFLTGAVAEYPEVQELIKQEIPYPVTPLEPPLKCPPGFPVTEYAVNIGLALKGFPGPRNREGLVARPVDWNILPKRYRSERKLNGRLLWAAGIMAGFALVFPLYQVNLGIQAENQGLEDGLARAQTIVRMKSQNLRHMGELQASLDEVIKAQEALRQEHQAIAEMGVPFSDPLQLIVDSAVPGITLSSIDYKGTEIALRGGADTYSDVISFTEALEGTGRFASANISKVEGGSGEPGAVSFLIKVGIYRPS